MPMRPSPAMPLVARGGAMLLGLLALAGCAATLVAPAPPREPREVALLAHNRHSTLLLTAADGTRVRWAYADWAWYVESERGLSSGVRALFADSQAALGRRTIPPAEPGENLERHVGVGIDRAIRFEAEAACVDSLLGALERRFESSPQSPRYSAEVNLDLVPHPRPYTFGYNSNHMVGDWLRALGVGVRGNPAFGRWRLAAGTRESGCDPDAYPGARSDTRE